MNKTTALITGSSDRIGKAIAFRLADMGYNLILHYNQSKEKADQLKIELTTLGVQCETLPIDFTKTNDFNSIIKNLFENYNIKILINNASDFIPSDFIDEGSELLYHHFRINFESAYLLTKSFAKFAESGIIINILDTKTEKNDTTHLDYILSKKLLKEFTLISAFKLAPNFRVNAIAPGLILPPRDKDLNYLLELSKKVPLQTIGDLTQIQNAVEFIINNNFITGQIIYINGGEHL